MSTILDTLLGSKFILHAIWLISHYYNFPQWPEEKAPINVMSCYPPPIWADMWVLTEEAAPINQEFDYTSEGISNIAMCLCNFVVKLCMSNPISHL